MAKRFILFLLLNFTALALGGLFTSSGVTSDWYTSMNQAPWTPPGWVFGAAWTTIMICFAFFMTFLYDVATNKKRILFLYAFQWILNVSWNPIFFEFKLVTLGLSVITALTILVGYFLTINQGTLKIKTLLVLPYFIWLLIATSLNAYIVFYN